MKKKEKRSQRHFKRIRNSPLEEVELPIPYGDDILTEEKKNFFFKYRISQFLIKYSLLFIKILIIIKFKYKRINI